MVQREKVTDARGRRWVSGALDPDTYFTEVRRTARAQAQRFVSARLRDGRRPRRPSLAGR